MEYRIETSPTELYRIEMEARRLRAEALRELFVGLRLRISTLFTRRAHRTA